MPRKKTEKPILKANKASKKSKNPKKKKSVQRAKIYHFVYKSKQFKLSIKQKLFCDHYLTMRLNAAESVIEAGYDVKNKNGVPNLNLARSIGSENLSKPNIAAYINRELDLVNLDEHSLKREHAKIILQDYDLPTKARGIDMHYKKFGLYAESRTNITVNSKLNNLTNQELLDIIKSGKAPEDFNNA